MLTVILMANKFVEFMKNDLMMVIIGAVLLSEQSSRQLLIVDNDFTILI